MRLRITVYLLLGLLVAACGASRMTQTPASSFATEDHGKARTRSNRSEEQKSADTEQPSRDEPFSNRNTIERIMSFLTSDNLKGREAGSEGIAKAASFIELFFKEHGVAPYFSSYKDTLTNLETTAYNVVGLVPGSDPELRDEYILIGAHYDHIGVLKGQVGDSIANGANDNASGTATVMELARYFGTKRTNKRSLIFALFSAEEKGLLGSEHLAGRLKEENLNLYVMLNFEMTGVPLVDKDYEAYVTGYDLSNLAEVCNSYASEKVVGFLPSAKEFNLFQRSDNYPFHKAFEVPSQTFCTFDFTNFDHYHQVGDELPLMDLDHMAGLVNTMIPVVSGVANAAAKEIRYH